MEGGSGGRTLDVTDGVMVDLLGDQLVGQKVGGCGCVDDEA